MKIEEEKGKGGMGLMVGYDLYLGLRTHVSCVLLTRLGLIRRGGTKEDSLTEVFSFSSFFFFFRTTARTCIARRQM